MRNSFVALGPGDPMEDIWLPMIFSDQLMLQCTMYTCSVHMAVIFGIDVMESMDVVTHRMETLSLLTKRLGDPNQAVNDITLTAVARYVGQVVCRSQAAILILLTSK